jgi:cell division protein FtsQ
VEAEGMTERPRRRPLPSAPMIDLPLHAGMGDEPPFLRPKVRTRIKRGRRGLLGRGVLALQLGGVGLLLVGGLWTGYSRVMASEKLKVGRVDVRGSHFLSEGEVREMLGPAVGENILALDIDDLKSRLRASPWVADATVRRALPDTLEVEIQERVPLALAEVDRLYLMDGEGALIELYGPRTAGFDLPIVRGLLGLDAESRADRASRAGELLQDLGDLAGEVSEVQVEASGELRLVLRGKGEVLRMGAAPPYRKRLQTFLGLRSELTARCPDAEYFDLRFRDRIYAQGPATPPPQAAAEPGASPVAPRPIAVNTAAPSSLEPQEPSSAPPSPEPAAAATPEATVVAATVEPTPIGR